VKKGKLYAIATSTSLVLFLVLLLFMISFTTVQSASPMITETQITNNKSGHLEPDIYDCRIVWEDERNVTKISTKDTLRNNIGIFLDCAQQFSQASQLI